MAHSERPGEVEQSLKDGAAEVKESAANIRDSAAHLVGRQKESGARQLSGIAGAVHAAADQLEDQIPGAAGYIHDAAERIDHVASELRNRKLSDIADGVRRLGQQRPLALFGGAVLVGFALTRFLKSAQGGEVRNRDPERT